MKILQVTKHSTVIGGVETYVADLHRLLQREGHRSFLLHGSVPGPLMPPGGVSRAIAAASLSTTALSPKAGAWSQRETELRRIIEEVAPDIILAHDLEDADVLGLLARLRPTIPFVHGPSPAVCPGRGKFYRRGQQVCTRPFGAYCLIAPYLHQCGTRRPHHLLARYRMTSRWIAIARSMKRLLVASEYMKGELRAVGFSEEQVVVNPPFVDLSLEGEGRALSDPVSVRRTVSGELPIVLFCGRFYDYKGAEWLLRALDFVRPALHAVLIGEGPEQRRLKRLAARVASRHRVSFPGWLSRAAVFSFYRRAHALVVPSVWPEPFGRVGPEAMAHGVPVVAFRVGAIPEWVHEGETGLLVAPKDVRGLAAALERLLTDEALAATLSAQAARFAAERFNARRHLDVLLRACEDVLREA